MDDDASLDKKALRATMRQLRLSQKRQDALSASRLAQRHLLASPLWRASCIVCLYASTCDEVGTKLLAEDAFAAGKTVLYPRVRKGVPGVMDYVPVCSVAELVLGSFGLLEPPSHRPGIGAAECTCDIVVMPGLAFAMNGARLGLGGGYYDRFFAMAKSRFRVGLCYSFQILDRLPCQPWDVAVTHVCSELGLAPVQS